MSNVESAQVLLGKASLKEPPPFKGQSNDICKSCKTDPPAPTPLKFLSLGLAKQSVTLASLYDGSNSA